MKRIPTLIRWVALAVMLVSVAGSAKARSKKVVVIETQFVEISRDSARASGVDWIVMENNPVDSTQPTETPTRKARKKSGSLVVSTYAFGEKKAPANGQAATAETGIVHIAGVFTDPQYRTLEQLLAKQKGIELVAAPTVRTEVGKPARIQIIGAETEGFEAGGALAEVFEKKKSGVELVVLPTVGSEGLTIDLKLAPEVIEFQGFINDAQEDVTAGEKTVLVGEAKNQISFPVFESLQGSTNVTIWDGQAVAIGGIVRQDTIATEKRVPLLGALPLLGRIFRSEDTFSDERELVIFVQAKLVDQDDTGE